MASELNSKHTETTDRILVARLVDRLKSLEVFDKGRCNDCFLLVERVCNSSF